LYLKWKKGLKGGIFFFVPNHLTKIQKLRGMMQIVSLDK
jgi:hypothetical protein